MILCHRRVSDFQFKFIYPYYDIISHLWLSTPQWKRFQCHEQKRISLRKRFPNIEKAVQYDYTNFDKLVDVWWLKLHKTNSCCKPALMLLKRSQKCLFLDGLQLLFLVSSNFLGSDCLQGSSWMNKRSILTMATVMNRCMQQSDKRDIAGNMVSQPSGTFGTEKTLAFRGYRDLF